MKAIQITFDERLLTELDEDEEVRRTGRSALLRRLAAEYLERRKQAMIDAQYERGYADGKGLGEEFEGWETAGVWPED